MPNHAPSLQVLALFAALLLPCCAATPAPVILNSDAHDSEECEFGSLFPEDIDTPADATEAVDSASAETATPTELDAGAAVDAGADSSATADTATDTPGDAQSAGDSGQSPDAWSPAPIPLLDPEPAPACSKAATNNDYFQFLDNLCGEKVLPSDSDRDLKCPVEDSSAAVLTKGGQLVTYAPSSEAVVWADLGLSDQLPAGLQVAVIAIRRVGGVPHYRYLSNGTAEQAVQPWSTSKILAAANAAATLRIQSNYAVGLTAATGSLMLGDLVTSLVNYDDSPYSSNSLGAYFHNIGGRAKANALIHADWLQRPATESFGGNYGSAAPAALGYQFAEPDGNSAQIKADQSSGPANNLSMYTLAEAVKRMVLHREEPTQRLPGIQWKDLRVLLYGAEGSKKYGAWGGMSADTAIYLQAGHDIAYLQARSQGRWRIFSKLGLGTKGQFVHVGYACLPVLDPQGKAVPGWGREFVIAAHLPTGGSSWKARDRLLAKAYRTLVTRLVDGSL